MKELLDPNLLAAYKTRKAESDKLEGAFANALQAAEEEAEFNNTNILGSPLGGAPRLRTKAARALSDPMARFNKAYDPLEASRDFLLTEFIHNAEVEYITAAKQMIRAWQRLYAAYKIAPKKLRQSGIQPGHLIRLCIPGCRSTTMQEHTHNVRGTPQINAPHTDEKECDALIEPVRQELGI